MQDLKAGPVERLEFQLAMLVRSLEALNRRRNHPLDRAHYLLLLQLRDGSLSISDLAGRLALDDSTVTRQIAAMQRRGFVRKRTSPSDRRSTLVERTAEGAERAEAMHLVRRQNVAKLFSDWSVQEQTTFAEMLERTNAKVAATLARIAAE